MCDAGTHAYVTHCQFSDNMTRGVVVDRDSIKASSCNVIRSAVDGFTVYSRGQAVLRECSSTNCSNGMRATGEGSRLVAQGCAVRQNGNFGVLVKETSVAVVRGCCSSGNPYNGYAAGICVQMSVISSTSDSDTGCGCAVFPFGQLIMVEVTVDGV